MIFENLLKSRKNFIKIGTKNDEFAKKGEIFARFHAKIEKMLTKFCEISVFEAVRRDANLVDLVAR